MPKISDLKLSWPASGSPDVTEYVVFLSEQPTPLTYDSESWNVGDVLEVNLADLDGMTTKDGVFDIGVAAVDSRGNISSMSKLDGVELDFNPPDPPGPLVLTTS